VRDQRRRALINLRGWTSQLDTNCHTDSHRTLSSQVKVKKRRLKVAMAVRGADLSREPWDSTGTSEYANCVPNENMLRKKSPMVGRASPQSQ
jgi:hypothetical protein